VLLYLLPIKLDNTRSSPTSDSPRTSLSNPQEHSLSLLWEAAAVVDGIVLAVEVLAVLFSQP
jgi:hypothetical protein